MHEAITRHEPRDSMSGTLPSIFHNPCSPVLHPLGLLTTAPLSLSVPRAVGTHQAISRPLQYATVCTYVQSYSSSRTRAAA